MVSKRWNGWKDGLLAFALLVGWLLAVSVGLLSLYMGFRYGFGDFFPSGDNTCTNEACADAYLEAMADGDNYRGP